MNIQVGRTDFFDEQLLRLKSALRVKKDQDVASALGMTRAAFSDRKRRGAFPEDKLFALKATLPDLDVFYVLTGERRDPADLSMFSVLANAAAQANDPELAAAVARGARNEVDGLRDALDYPLVRRLVGLSVFCTDADIETLCRMAFRMRRREAMPFNARSVAVHDATEVRNGDGPTPKKGRTGTTSK